jgi:predicted hydrocarbon binding protein
MQPIPASGNFYANKFALSAIIAMEEIVGKNGMDAILNMANLPQMIDNYPPDDLERAFDFADFSSINLALEEIYGQRGGWSLALRAGRAIFNRALQNVGALAGMGNPAFRSLPLQLRLRMGLPVIARVFSQFADQHSTVQGYADEFVFTVHRCPFCWGRSGADKPVCYMTTGFLQAGLKWISGGPEFSIRETRCIAMGDETCDFVIQKPKLE